ncbi:MAG: hypothetical protein RL153_2021, partial [Verrucomicrobiota bacterium]
VRMTFTQAKSVLNLFRELALGKTEPYAELCRLFDRQTEQGNNLRAYDDQLRSAVTSITATFQQKLAAGLQSGRQFILPTLEEQVAADSEFELLTWLVILSPASPGT